MRPGVYSNSEIHPHWPGTHTRAVDQRLLAVLEQHALLLDEARSELRVALHADDVEGAARAGLRLMSCGMLMGLASRDHERDSR